MGAANTSAMGSHFFPRAASLLSSTSIRAFRSLSRHPSGPTLAASFCDEAHMSRQRTGSATKPWALRGNEVSGHADISLVSHCRLRPDQTDTSRVHMHGRMPVHTCSRPILHICPSLWPPPCQLPTRSTSHITQILTSRVRVHARAYTVHTSLAAGSRLPPQLLPERCTWPPSRPSSCSTLDLGQLLFLNLFRFRWPPPPSPRCLL
ncbi:hypothetical protein ACQKWADRAFT_152000 [Trichoderma austrokoningii]